MTVPAAFPADEAQRIAELHDYCILDTAPDERFDRITALAAELYDAPIALVSLVDTERQWFKSCLGLPVRETPRDIAFCGYTILSDTPFVVENALEHPLFRDNPLVRGDPQIRFYAGVPLTGRNGHRLGSFCMIDRRPRQLAAHEILRLTKLAEIVVDELELHKAQMEAERTLAAQTAANQLKNKFLSSMSHEFRTPLNAILGFSQILEMNARGMLNRDELGYVAAIKAAGDTLLQLSDGMLTMAQLEAGAVPFEIERLSAQEIIGDAFRQHHPTAVMNRLTLTSQFCRTPLAFRGDYSHLLRIIGHFVSNAFKFTAAGGRVTLGCACESGRDVTLYVEDTGCGIPRERHPEAFQSFNRLGREGTAVAGIGLGLAIARRLAHTMNAEIGFESQEQVGSRFWIRLPAA